MESENVIDLKHVTKTFTIHHEKKNSVYEYLTSFLNRKNTREEIIVLEDVSFSVKRGEMLGIIGLNGSGKTTLLKLLGRIYVPNSGEITVNGKVTPFLELGTGFNGELTAKDNIILYGIILGFTRKEITKKIDEIMHFSELEKFLDTKLKNFSAGMNARLAFSTAIQVNPDILLVDEVLAVGDAHFQKKSFEAFMSFKKRGKTILYVTHSLEQISALCDKALLLHNGRVRAFGKPSDVISVYNKIIDNGSENRLLEFKPWFHDFSKLGIDTATDNLAIPNIRNQDDKEPIITNFLSKAFNEVGKNSMLDMFCGNGYYSIYALKKFNPKRIVAIDKEQRLVEGGKFILQQLGLPEIEFHVLDVQSLNMPEKFDIVLNTTGLYNYEDPEKILKITYNLTNKFAIIQSVVTLETEDENYFVKESNGGSRFTDANLKKMINKFDWKIIDHKRNTLSANTKLSDKGSSYFLCRKTK